MPKQENVKILVAIKELSDRTNPGSDTELLEEARIMASVMHPCCIRIMAVCITRQMMLVTPLVSFGSLLDYLHRNRSNIGSRSMLTWAKQIAEVSAKLLAVLSIHSSIKFISGNKAHKNSDRYTPVIVDYCDTVMLIDLVVVVGYLNAAYE